MKKALAILLALSLTAALAACGKQDESSDKSDAATTTTTTAATDSPQDSKVSDESSDVGEVLGSLEPGKLFVFPLEEGEEQVLRNVRLAGNQAGTAEFNEKDPTERVRCIFMLSEWVEIYPDTDAESGLKCWAFRHKDDLAFYLDNTLSEETEGFAQMLELNKDPDDETLSWGSFYLNPEECEAGLYDLVFTYNDKPVGALITKFYNNDELMEKSDEELEELMKGIIS
ncbi:MAG: hypothetical protein IK990_20755 [Ruminiclostridium sp.]|nr:hypothetical protein [Ruminiclostridium sp.]